MSNINIKIKISELMTLNTNEALQEGSLIRISEKLRFQLGLDVGKKLSFDTPNGDTVELTVSRAVKDDILQDDGICYVTRETFNKINVENTYKYLTEPVKGISLGCDPELFLVDRHTNKLLKAHMFLKKWGEVGSDGILAELRPKPSISANDVTNSLYSLIQQLRNVLNRNALGYDPNRIMLYGASSKENSTAGFHLHYGLPNQILGKRPATVALMQQIVKVMDYYVGLTSIMVDGKNDIMRRCNTLVTYGKPGDFRLDGRTLEYRVPGGVMLKHPVLTEGLLALGAVVMEDIISKIKTATNDYKHLYWVHKEERIRELYPNILQSNIMFNVLCGPSTEQAKSYLKHIYYDVSKMNGFSERSEILKLLFSAIENNTQFDNDIELNWRKFYEQQMEVCTAPYSPAVNCARS